MQSRGAHRKYFADALSLELRAVKGKLLTIIRIRPVHTYYYAFWPCRAELDRYDAVVRHFILYFVDFHDGFKFIRYQTFWIIYVAWYRTSWRIFLFKHINYHAWWEKGRGPPDEASWPSKRRAYFHENTTACKKTRWYFDISVIMICSHDAKNAQQQNTYIHLYGYFRKALDDICIEFSIYNDF